MAQRTTSLPRPDAGASAAEGDRATSADTPAVRQIAGRLGAAAGAAAGAVSGSASGALTRLRERAARREAERDGRPSHAERDARRRDEALRVAEEGATDWAHVGIFGAGLVVGALVGAGAALLLAPTTGFEARARLARNARRTGGRVAHQWDDLSDSVRRGVKRGRRRAGRAVTSSRWAAEDAWERRRER